MPLKTGERVVTGERGFFRDMEGTVVKDRGDGGVSVVLDEYPDLPMAFIRSYLTPIRDEEESPMKLVVEINMDNDAFQPFPGPELDRILSDLADRVPLHTQLEEGELFRLRDINGNKVGWARVETDDE